MNKYRTKNELEQLLLNLEVGDIIQFENISGESLAKFDEDKTLILSDGRKVPHTHILKFMEYVSRDYNNGKHRYILTNRIIQG